MSDIKLNPEEQAIFNEVGSRGDYFREAIQDRAAQQVNETGRTSEITSDGGSIMFDAVLAPDPTTSGDRADEIVPPSDFAAVAGPAPGVVPEAPANGQNPNDNGA